MKLGNVLLTLAIAAALATASMSVPASAQADDVLSREAVLHDPDIPDLGNAQGDLSLTLANSEQPYRPRGMRNIGSLSTIS